MALFGLIVVSQAQWNDLVATVKDTNQKISTLIAQEKKIMADLTQLTSDVQSNGDAVASAVTLLQGLKAALDAAGTDPTKLAALSASLEANTKSLADAVVANTPAA